jgi:hypothetical protein
MVMPLHMAGKEMPVDGSFVIFPTEITTPEEGMTGAAQSDVNIGEADDAVAKATNAAAAQIAATALAADTSREIPDTVDALLREVDTRPRWDNLVVADRASDLEDVVDGRREATRVRPDATNMVCVCVCFFFKLYMNLYSYRSVDCH